MNLEADERLMRTLDDSMVRIRHRFRVVPGQGIFHYEDWMLVGGEWTYDWNYWIVLVMSDYYGDWEIREIVPWWGPYEEWSVSL